MYDKDRLRTHFFAATGGLLVLSLLFYTLAVFRHVKRGNSDRIKKQQNLIKTRMMSFSNSPNFSPERSPSDTLVSPERSGSDSRQSVPRQSVVSQLLSNSDPRHSVVSQKCSDSVSKHFVKWGRTQDAFYHPEDRKLSKGLNNEPLILSSALKKPFKIAISLSAPLLAIQTDDDGRFCMAAPNFNIQDVQQVTDV